MRVVIAGCGRVGSQLVTHLDHENHNVVVIDRDPRAGERLSKTFHGEFHTGLAFDLDVLHEAGIEEAAAFVALTNYDNTNLMAAEVGRGIYGVRRVVSRLFNPDKEETYQALDIDFVNGTSLLAEQVMQRLLPRRPRILSRTANNRVLIVEFEYPERRQAVRASKLEGEEMLRVGLVARGGDTAVASPETVLRGGDTVVAAVLAPRLGRLRRLLARDGGPVSPRPRNMRARTKA